MEQDANAPPMPRVVGKAADAHLYSPKDPQASGRPCPRWTQGALSMVCAVVGGLLRGRRPHMRLLYNKLRGWRAVRAFAAALAHLWGFTLPRGGICSAAKRNARAARQLGERRQGQAADAAVPSLQARST